MWAHFLGYGFTSPFDDLGPHNVPTHPALLEYLGQEFQSSEHDLRQLISWIVLSKPYGLSSRQNKSNASDDPLLGEPPKFSHFYLRQMQAEQLYESILVATGNTQQSASYAEQERIKNQWLQQFTTAFGTDEGGESTSFNGTIPQVLMMFNGDMIKTATSTMADGGLIDQINRIACVHHPESRNAISGKGWRGNQNAKNLASLNRLSMPTTATLQRAYATCGG